VYSTYKKQHFALQDHGGGSRRGDLRPVGGYGEAPFDTPFELGRLVILKNNNKRIKRTIKQKIKQRRTKKITIRISVYNAVKDKWQGWRARVFPSRLHSHYRAITEDIFLQKYN